MESDSLGLGLQAELFSSEWFSISVLCDRIWLQATRFLQPKTIKDRQNWICLKISKVIRSLLFCNNPWHSLFLCMSHPENHSNVCFLSVKPYTLGSSFVCLRFPCMCGKLWRWCSLRRCVTPVGFRPGDSWPFITNSHSRTQACSVSHVAHLHSSHVAFTLPGTGMTFCVCVSACVDANNDLSV